MLKSAGLLLSRQGCLAACPVRTPAPAAVVVVTSCFSCFVLPSVDKSWELQVAAGAAVVSCHDAAAAAGHMTVEVCESTSKGSKVSFGHLCS